MSDGSRLRQSWQEALSDAESRFRKLLTTPSSPEWKRISSSVDNSSNGKGKARVSTIPELADVVLHRKTGKSGDDIYRIVLDVPTGEEEVSLQQWRAVLAIPELSKEWDPAVEDAHLVEVFDHTTRICKTNFTLGWPANPRDAVTISRSFHDATTVIDITTSLPRSPDEPAYLRPSPPFVRSKVSLFAWCIQYMQPPQSPQPQSGDRSKKRGLSGGRIRITCFWQHDLRALWGFGSLSGLSQQLCTMTLGLLKTVMKRGSRIPLLCGYGNGVTIERVRFQIDRQALTVDYAIVPEDDVLVSRTSETTQGLDELHAIREQRRLTRSIECALASSEGWDIQISTKASSQRLEQLPWTTDATRRRTSQSLASEEFDEILLRVTHSALLDDHSVLKVKLVIEVSGPSGGIRLNGLPKPVQSIKERDPSSYYMSQQILQDVSSAAELSFHTVSSVNTTNTASSSTSVAPSVSRPPAERTAAAEKSVLSRVRRNYIYFSSLLQEPEAKWKRTTEARGVSVTQLDSIDPTLVVYRAEATFVGVGLWDLYGALVSPGAKSFWDKQHDDAILLEDVNELTELWHFKTRPAWPVNGRDSVVLKTVYKSPMTIHVFSFSADDPHLFLNIPPADPNVIRTQVDLQGWAIESLSPTTTLLTLLEQSDPKGWTNKTSIPQQMINSLAGIGEFAIKCGGPPVVTRLSGAKSVQQRYDHERGSFKIEYEASASRRGSNDGGLNGIGSSSLPVIECELRCDVDTWASSLDVVVDPPPQSIICLRRHRLSAEGGGLWLTMAHDAVFAGDERLLVIVRKGVGKEKGLVMVNGTKVTVDVEELPEHEIKTLTKKKRVKPPRIPLDQPPVMGAIRRRRAEWDADADSNEKPPDKPAPVAGWASAPRLSSPLARFFTTAIEQATSTTQQAVAAISPATAPGDSVIPSSSKLPVQYALEALHWIRESHARFASEGWAIVSEKGLPVHRKLSLDISPSIPVHKGEKVIEGVSAEELVSVVKEYNCRKKWDDRFDSATTLESFGGDCQTSFVVCKGGFPFRDRGFYLASVVARAPVASPLARRAAGDPEQGSRNAIYYVSASFSPESVASFAPTKYNPYTLPIGRVFIDAWIFETLDPYTTEKYAIPSARCTRVVAVDYAGSIPAAVNSSINATLPKSILAVEGYIKSISPLPITRLPAPALVILDRKIDDLVTNISWKLRRRDDSRALISTRFKPDERIYHTRVLLTSPSNPLPLTPATDYSTPRPSRRLTNPQSLNSPEISHASISDVSASTSTLTGSSTHQRESSLSSIKASSRSTSSAFTIKGEVRPSTDLLVAEVIVDSKLYPDGYDVHVCSAMRGATKHVPLWAPEQEESQSLPFTYSVHTMPSSPLHSSGLNTDRPSRHLLRLTLPTAQYLISTVLNPLTGETQTPPAKPQWFLELQDRGAIVDIQIKPAPAGLKRDNTAILFDGVGVTVVNEKESLTSLGRDELQDDKVSKMATLSRAQDDGEPLPKELQAPLAVAHDLLEPSAAGSFTVPPQDTKGPEEADTKAETSNETPSAVSL
jgi:hypothetical protein